ncbi:ABC transporter ATP-binding protein [Raoultibacter timonensis]|uniref:Glycine/betaine ABC transporter ATP-binding protein n=1 Tax=Raoultibacter timonensis TaxID=1907662 RepID=A0ABM7WKZ1_9ACTN|nr:ABC transporter ATP-binding protein [Raoultibacter timonensis]BDE97057.1 glycine/betaine ABC transporter ATP-binding protein [Raoultibacter timonensis]BDF51661.1 glycine/betaine ABC transporter ATP-binding protein [Raoultibacter timonensis]
MKAIEMIDVTKRFPDASAPAVNSVSLSIDEGEFITILGTSGCGKTTLLKMVNRLYEPTEGTIMLFGEDISTVDKVVVRRRIGYVIQQVGLFPHMTIADNVATVPKLLKWEKPVIERRVDELLEVVGLDPREYRGRYPSQLSGGQQQRVGLARALAVDPKIMLLDEPFGAIDAITRTSLQDELLRLHKDLRKTFLFVTHDINEAFKLGDRVIVMDGGRVRQFDTPRNIALNPADGFTASLIASAREQERFWEELE